MKRFHVVLLAVSLWTMLFTGCGSKPVIDDVMLPYTTVRTIVLAELPGGLRKQSSNGREVESGYFSWGSLDDTDGEELSERAYAKVVILGSSRPYRLDVRVFKEKRAKKSKTYAKAGEDRKLARELVTRLKESLANRRDDRNVIDDFRAF